MKQKLAFAKNYIADRKVAILTTALVVTTTAAVAMRAGLNDHDKFLKEHDLYDAYYTPED